MFCEYGNDYGSARGNLSVFFSRGAKRKQRVEFESGEFSFVRFFFLLSTIRWFYIRVEIAMKFSHGREKNASSALANL